MRIQFIPLGAALRGVFVKVLDSLAAEPAPRLFHYTKLSRFESMLQSNRFRATSASQLNDRSEISHGIGILRQLVDEELEKHGQGMCEFSKAVIRCIPDYCSERTSKIYVASFCEAEDLLSQWRSYGLVQLEFVGAVQLLSQLRPPSRYFDDQIVKAIYDREEQKQALKQALRGVVFALNDQGSVSGEFYGEWAMPVARTTAANIAGLFMYILSSFKHPSFYEEKEWRFVVSPRHTLFSSDLTEADRMTALDICERDGRRFVELMPVVHVRAFQPLSSERLPILGVKVGPCDKQFVYVERVKGELHKARYSGVQIAASEIPTVIEMV
jgi:hypothetical protein